MVTHPGEIGSIRTTAEEQRRLALLSHSYVCPVCGAAHERWLPASSSDADNSQVPRYSTDTDTDTDTATATATASSTAPQVTPANGDRDSQLPRRYTAAAESAAAATVAATAAKLSQVPDQVPSLHHRQWPLKRYISGQDALIQPIQSSPSLQSKTKLNNEKQPPNIGKRSAKLSGTSTLSAKSSNHNLSEKPSKMTPAQLATRKLKKKKNLQLARKIMLYSGTMLVLGFVKYCGDIFAETFHK
jgi:hypothetical protein